MGIGVLGPLSAGATSLSPRDRVVLSALVVRHGSVASAEELADALWGDQPPVSWHKVVPGCVNRLRKALGAGAIVTAANGYRLELEDGEVDIRRFERLVAKGHQMLALGEPDRAILAFREALALWRGPALREVEEWPPARAEIERLDELRLETEEAVVDASLQVGLQAGILAEARARVSQAPVRERRWALLALAQYLSGSQADALSTLRRARDMLSRELGLDPGPELVALERAMLHQDPSLTAATALPRPAARCPYPGLLPYEVGDADFFFGRSTDLAACRRRLSESGVLVLVGPSGSGKSSLLRAGLAASLSDEGRPCVIVPTGASEEELLAEIEDGDADTVLVLDQVEEVVARFTSSEQRARLSGALVACSRRRPLALAIRADRFGDLAELAEFAGLAERGLVLLVPLDEEGLRDAIEGPARQAALLLEPGLVDVLLQDVRSDPGALPLLSHALRETWERRDGRTLTVEGYRASGGIRGAVARSAEQVYDDLPEADRERLRGLMLRLLTLAPDGEPLRSAVPREAIPGDAAHEHLVERLVRARLVTADADVLDLAHETLARAWPRLRGWLDDDLEGQRTLRHLSTAAESWHAMGRPEAELYRGDRLLRATAWHESSGADLTVHESEFLAQSREVAGAAAAEAARSEDARRRTRRRTRTLVAVATTLAVVAGAAGWLAFGERRQAAADRERAASERLLASARRAASLSQSSDDLSAALLLAVEAVRRDDTAESHATLLAALSRSPELVRVISGGGEVQPSLDGRTVFLRGDEVRQLDVRSFDPRPGDRLPALLAEPGHEIFVDGDGVHAELRDGQLRTVWRPADDGRELQWQGRSDGLGHRVAVAVDRESLDAARYESTITVWNPARPRRPRVRVEIPGTAAHGGVDDHQLTRRGHRMFVVSRDAGPWLRTYDARSGAVLDALTLPVSETARGTNRVNGFLQLSPDESILATNLGSDLVLVDARTLRITSRLRGHTHPVIAAEFSPDDRLVAASAMDGSVLVWDRFSGALLERLEGNRVPVRSLGFSPDASTLYGSVDDSVLVWDLEGSRRVVSARNGAAGQLGYLVVSAPDGRSAAYFRGTLTTFGRDASFDLVAVPGGHRSVPAGFANWGTYSPSGREIATVVGRRLQLWSAADGRPLRESVVPGIAHAEAATFTADGAWIVVADRDGVVRAVDASTLAPVGVPASLDLPLADLVAVPGRREVLAIPGPHDGPAPPVVIGVDPTTGAVGSSGPPGEGVAFAAVSPDGMRAAVTMIDGGTGLVDLATGRWLARPSTGHSETASAVDFSGDGSRVATSGFDGRVVLWDGSTGERLASIQPVGPEYATGVSFLPDGHTVGIAASNGQLFRWDTDPAAWLAHACRVAGRNLDEQEWRRAFGSEPYRETCPEKDTG